MADPVDDHDLDAEAAQHGHVDEEIAEIFVGDDRPIDGDDDDEDLWVHELVGATVSLVDGAVVGTVTEVQANPAADLLVLDSGALVPIVFITDRSGGSLIIDPPDGLFDL